MDLFTAIKLGLTIGVAAGVTISLLVFGGLYLVNKFFKNYE